MRVTLLHNPGAGEEDHEPDELRSQLAAAGHVVSYHSLTDEGWEEAFADAGDLVVVAGGDGSVGRVLDAVAASALDCLVTLLPLGSANNLARTIGIADVPAEQLIGGWESGRRVRFDVGQASAAWGETLFVESVGGGIFGQVLERAEDADADGEEKLRLGLELMRSVIGAAPALAWRVEVDGVDLSDELLAVEAANIRELGPNFPLAPEADPGDGGLDVVLVRPDDREALVGYFSDRLDGKEPRVPELFSRRGQRIVLRPPMDCPLHVDDEFWPDDPDARADGTAVVAVARAVSVLVPG
jgi:diacylglycerol kinase (ATP)